SVVGDFYGVGAGRADRPYIALPALAGESPKGNASSIRRPARLDSIALSPNNSSFSRGHPDSEQRASYRSEGRIRDDLRRRVPDLGSIGRQSRIESGAGETLQVLAVRIHDVDSAAISFGPESQQFAIGRELRLPIVGGGVGSQVHWRRSVPKN